MLSLMNETPISYVDYRSFCRHQIDSTSKMLGLSKVTVAVDDDELITGITASAAAAARLEK